MFVCQKQENISWLRFKIKIKTWKLSFSFLMIPNGEWWHYLELKKLWALLRRMTSKTNGGFYYLNCLHSLRTK